VDPEAATQDDIHAANEPTFSYGLSSAL